MKMMYTPSLRKCQALDAEDRANQRPVGTNQHSEDLYNNESDVQALAPTGNSTAAFLRRLRKDRPDIHARVRSQARSARMPRPARLELLLALVAEAQSIRLPVDAIRGLVQRLRDRQDVVAPLWFAQVLADQCFEFAGEARVVVSGGHGLGRSKPGPRGKDMSRAGTQFRAP
jgi:hypothetical protein